MSDIVDIANAAIRAIAPFLPALLDKGKKLGESVVDGVVKRATDSGLAKAEAVWNKLRGRVRSEPEFAKAIADAADEQVNEKRHATLVASLIGVLDKSPDLVPELEKLLDFSRPIQEVQVSDDIEAADFRQDLQGLGQQKIKVAGGSKAVNIVQKAR